MVQEIFQILIKAALPVALLSYLLMRWSLKSGRLEASGDKKALRQGLKAMKKGRKSKTARSKNPLHNKWLKFGGGFYGAVGLYTFIVVEAGEVMDLAAGYEGMEAMIAGLGQASFFDLAVNFLVNSLMNFVIAIAWPAYWAGGLEGGLILLWLGLTYGGYLLGLKLARVQNI